MPSSHPYCYKWQDFLFSHRWIIFWCVYVYIYTHIYVYLYVYVCMCVYACVLSHFSRVGLFETLWTVAHQAPLSMGFSRQEYWSGLPFPTPGDLHNPGIKSASLMSPALVGGFLSTRTIWEAHVYVCVIYISHLYPLLIDGLLGCS